MHEQKTMEDLNQLQQQKNMENEGIKQKENAAGRTIIQHRWIILLCFIPLCYAAAYDKLSVESFLMIFACVWVYNTVVTFYMLKVYPKNHQIPDYIYHIDILVISIMSYLFGGLASDVYVVNLFVIAAYCAAHSIPDTMRFTGVAVSIYSISCVLYSLMHIAPIHYTQLFFMLLVRVVELMFMAYGIGLLVAEVRKAGSLHRKEFERARTDRLTGLPNRHFMEQQLVQELRDCDENGKVLNVLVFDIDNFKKFNDTYGHLWGDELLKRFAANILQSIRKSDIPIRYGGEEFIVLVKDIDFATAKGVADRVRRSLEKEKIIIDDGVTQRRVTVSCGIAQYPTHSKHIKEVIEMADKALYGAKQLGKNVVVGYDEFSRYEMNRSEILEKESFVTEQEKEVSLSPKKG